LHQVFSFLGKNDSTLSKALTLDIPAYRNIRISTARNRGRKLICLLSIFIIQQNKKTRSSFCLKKA